MRIFKYDNKLVEEISRATLPTIEVRVLRDEDKDQCPHCGKPVDTVFSLIEESSNFKSMAKPVETLPPLNN